MDSFGERLWESVIAADRDGCGVLKDAAPADSLHPLAARCGAQTRSETLFVIVTAAPCVGVSTILTVSASRW